MTFYLNCCPRCSGAVTTDPDDGLACLNCAWRPVPRPLPYLRHPGLLRTHVATDADIEEAKQDELQEQEDLRRADRRRLARFYYNITGDTLGAAALTGLSTRTVYRNIKDLRHAR